MCEKSGTDSELNPNRARVKTPNSHISHISTDRRFPAGLISKSSYKSRHGFNEKICILDCNTVGK